MCLNISRQVNQMLLWTPGECEGQKLHLWLAASCQSAQSGGAREGGREVEREDVLGMLAKDLVIISPSKTTTPRSQREMRGMVLVVLK